MPFMIVAVLSVLVGCAVYLGTVRGPGGPSATGFGKTEPEEDLEAIEPGAPAPGYAFLQVSTQGPELREPAFVERPRSRLPCIRVSDCPRRSSLLEHHQRRLARGELACRARRRRERGAREVREPGGEGIGREHAAVGPRQLPRERALAPEPDRIHRWPARGLAREVHRMRRKHHLRLGERRGPVDLPGAARQVSEHVVPQGLGQGSGDGRLARRHAHVPAVGAGNPELHAVGGEVLAQGRDELARLGGLDRQRAGRMQHQRVAFYADMNGIGTQPMTRLRSFVRRERDRRHGRGVEAVAAPQPRLAAARRVARQIGAREPPLEVRQARLRGGGREQTGNDEV